MASPSLIVDQPCRLLDCPRDIRDEIYTHLLLDFPVASHSELMERALQDPASIHLEDKETIDGACDFDSKALQFVDQRHNIATNILLVNRQVFAEAKEMILRRAQLVKVVAFNIDLSRQLFAGQICLIDVKYSNLCILTHHFNECTVHAVSSAKHEFVLCGRDVDNFCRAIMGDNALTIRPRLCREIANTLSFVAHFTDQNTIPEYLKKDSTHRKILQPSRNHLREFYNVSVHGHHVGLSRTLAIIAARDMQDAFIPDPEKLLADIHSLQLLGRKLESERGIIESAIPIEKALALCRRPMWYYPFQWEQVQRKAADPKAFREEMARRAYSLLYRRIEIAQHFLVKATPAERDALKPSVTMMGVAHRVMRTYYMSVAIRKRFGASSWAPDTWMETSFNNNNGNMLFSWGFT
ncbi:hypothetical protein Daus18300_005624 [Diaporthe australafricana]|uniref:Uncharacterized protein n=1 Tax=Diaporthe australafricana TaxID=127596 RepID=A0ABR3X148_9PEZI